MKQLMAVGVAVLLALTLSVSVRAEGPEASMYTLSDIYYFLTAGVEASEGGHSLEPPEDAVPGDERFQSLAQIYAEILPIFAGCQASPENVRTGKVFFCTQKSTWGVQTGTGQ